MVLSSPALTNWYPFLGENDTELTFMVWPLKTATHRILSNGFWLASYFQSRQVLSLEPEIIKSLNLSTEIMISVCPAWISVLPVSKSINFKVSLFEHITACLLEFMNLTSMISSRNRQWDRTSRSWQKSLSLVSMSYTKAFWSPLIVIKVLDSLI